MLSEKDITIGKKIKQLRETKGLTQQQVADHLQLHQSAYANAENGNRQLRAWELLQLAQLFDFNFETFRKGII